MNHRLLGYVVLLLIGGAVPGAAESRPDAEGAAGLTQPSAAVQQDTSHGNETEFAILPPPTRISPHVYAWLGPQEPPNPGNKGFRMNLGFVVGTHAVAVLDTGYYPAMAEEMVRHIRKLTKLPIKYAVNTSSQPYRFFGNVVFHKLGTTIIAHHKEVERMREQQSNFAGAIQRTLELPSDSVALPNLPDQIINDDILLDLGGGVKLELMHLKAAHTPAPLLVHVPKDNVIYTGDVLYAGRLPALVAGGNIKEWLETFDSLRRFGTATFIPGHGAPGPLQDFEFTTYEYLSLLHGHMERMVKTDVEMEDAIRMLDQSKFAKLPNYSALAARNASRAYLEAEQASLLR